MSLVTRRINFSDRRDYHLNGGKWYGNDYQLSITFRGNIAPKKGYIVDMAILRALVDTRLISRVEQRYQNGEVCFLTGKTLPLKVLTVAIYEQIGTIELPRRVLLEKVEVLVPWASCSYGRRGLTYECFSNCN